MLDTAERSTANCNICKYKVARGVSSASDYNITILNKHQAKEYKEFVEVK